MRKPDYTLRTRTENIVVHCSADLHRTHRTFNDLRMMHMMDPRFKFIDVGYHFGIERDATIRIGRPVWAEGAHVKGIVNRLSVGIVMLGGLDDDMKPDFEGFTPEMFESLRLLIDGLRAKYPNAGVSGHRDWLTKGNAKDCPCFDAAHWYFHGDLRAATMTEHIDVNHADRMIGLHVPWSKRR